MHKFTKRTTAVLVGILVAAGASTVAYAYWTAGGDGTGEAVTGTNVELEAIQTTTVADMGPGDVAQALSGNFNNDSDGPVYVTSVTATIGAITGDGPGVTCDEDDYTLAGGLMLVGAEVLPGDAQGTWSGATIKFNNSLTENQDDCKNATVEILYEIV